MNEYAYKIIDGVKCYNPEVALSNDYYPTDAFEILFKLEHTNFWFKARNRLIMYLFKKFIPAEEIQKTLEIGCGTGFVLNELKNLPGLKLYGAEVHLEGLKFASNRLPNIEFFQTDVTNMSFKSEFDIICTFDVLEHITGDEKAIVNIKNALKPKGLFFISVPQHKFLWGAIDVLSDHKRRYSRRELIDKLKNGGFKILSVTSFVFSLFPLMVISRLINKKKLPQNNNGIQDLFHEFRIPGILNSVFGIFMRIDEYLIRLGLKLPFGGSLMIVSEKELE